MIKRLILFIFLLMLFKSCVHFVSTRQKPLQVFLHKDYKVEDSLYLNDMIICSSYRADNKSEGFSKPVIDHDSIKNRFLNSISKSYSRISISNNVQYHCDPSFQANYMVDLKKVDYKKLISLSKHENFDTGLVMIPLIYIDVADIRFTSISARHMVNRDEDRHYYVKILLTLINAKFELVYSRFFYTGEVVEHENNYNPKCTIPQERWDKMVYKLMRDFTKRLK